MVVGWSLFFEFGIVKFGVAKSITAAVVSISLVALSSLLFAASLSACIDILVLVDLHTGNLLMGPLSDDLVECDWPYFFGDSSSIK